MHSSLAAGGPAGAVPGPRRVPVHLALRGLGHARPGGHGQRAGSRCLALPGRGQLRRARLQRAAGRSPGTPCWPPDPEPSPSHSPCPDSAMQGSLWLPRGYWAWSALPCTAPTRCRQIPRHTSLQPQPRPPNPLPSCPGARQPQAGPWRLLPRSASLEKQGPKFQRLGPFGLKALQLQTEHQGPSPEPLQQAVQHVARAAAL